MDAATRQTLESFAWDCTIGNGMAEEYADRGQEPDKDVLDALKRILGRRIRDEEMEVFQAAWDRCLLEASFP